MKSDYETDKARPARTDSEMWVKAGVVDRAGWTAADSRSGCAAEHRSSASRARRAWLSLRVFESNGSATYRFEWAAIRDRAWRASADNFSAQAIAPQRESSDACATWACQRPDPGDAAARQAGHADGRCAGLGAGIGIAGIGQIVNPQFVQLDDGEAVPAVNRSLRWRTARSLAAPRR